MSYADRDRRMLDRERRRRRAADRIARGLCPKCGVRAMAPQRRLCAECAEKKRVAERARYAAGKAAGKLYGGRCVKTRRRDGRERGRDRHRARREAGICTACGRQPAAEGAAVCEGCRSIRRARERERYSMRRAEGCCVRCRVPVPAGASRCRRCADKEAARTPRARKNAGDRKRYARRRARNLCEKCGAWSGAASACEACARRSRMRSSEHRGLPVTATRYTVIEIATSRDHGTYDNPAEVAACLAFARLGPEDVEIVTDASPMAALTSW